MLRYLLIIGAVVSALVSPLSAQQPGNNQPPSSNPQHQARLQELLKLWEADVAGLKEVVVKFVSEETESVRPGPPDKRVGALKFMKIQQGTTLVRMDSWDPLANGDIDTRRPHMSFIFNGNFGYQIAYKQQVMTTTEIKNRKLNEGPLPFFSGMKADEAMKRYDIKVEKMDQFYTYLKILPRFENDQREFTVAELVILNVNHPQGIIPKDFIAQFSWQEASKKINTWKIVGVWKNDQAQNYVKRSDFEKPVLPKDWKEQINDVNTTTGRTNPMSNLPPSIPTGIKK